MVARLEMRKGLPRDRELFYTLVIVVMTEHICKTSQNSILNTNTYNLKHKRKRRVRNPGYKQVKTKNYIGSSQTINYSVW